MLFIDLEKAHDRVFRKIEGIENMYNGALTNMRTIGGDTSAFQLPLHQDSA